nr:MAG TPA: membrane protein [Caudoviricetes sp.]
MEFQNFIYLLLTCIWLTGLLWASVIVYRSRKKK